METTRDLDRRWDDLSLKDQFAELRRRGQAADDWLRPRLKAGDKLRATKSVCGSREASFTFSHWEGDRIVSTGGSLIAPSQVYSVNGDVLRF
ncbi:hypothetical protein ACSSV1_001909 [Labrenzia sp. MBR-25]